MSRSNKARLAVYAVLLVIGVGWSIAVLHGQRHSLTDWINFEIAARSFMHFHHQTVYAGPRLGLYTKIPGIQSGPPSWLPLIAFQWIAPWTLNVVFVMVMVLLGLGSIAAVDSIARGVLPDVAEGRRLLVTLVLGAGVMIVWSYNVASWHHIDDSIALSFTAFACLLIQRQRAWWLVGVLLGTGIAAKPWAMILAPVLLGLPRSTRVLATLLTIVVAGAWWVPFVLGDTATIRALGSYPIHVSPGSVWWLLGLHEDIHRWLRPVQFIAGIALGVWVAKRPGNAWLAAPLAAVALRVLTDPYAWSYYSMGPVLLALMWDLTRPGRVTKLPVYTAATLLVEGLLAWLPRVVGPGSLHGWVVVLEWGKLLWGVAVIAAIIAEVRSPASTGPAALSDGDSVPAPAPA